MNRTLTTLAIVVALVLFTLLFIEHPAIETDTTQTPSEITPISIIQNATTRQYSENGGLEYRLDVATAKQFLRFTNSKPLSLDQGYTELTNPTLVIYDQTDSDQWRFRANHGRTENSGELIILSGDVVATKPGSNGNDYQLTTQRIEIQPNRQLASTNEAVNIRSPNGVADAVGLTIDMNTGVTELKSEVRGTFNVDL